MKKITLFLTFIVFQFNYAQNTCATAATAAAGVTSVGTIDGTLDNACSWTTAGTLGEWYAYTPSISGVATITTNLPQNDGVTNSDDTRLSVFTGTCAGLTCYAIADDVSTTVYLTTLTMAIDSGTTYYLHWDDRWSAAPFDFEITEATVTCPDGSLPFSDDFTDPNTLLACWETIDNDGDGQGWFAADYDQNGDMSPDGNPMLGSASWNDVALTPDNWLISPQIDLTPYSSGDTIELTWDARGIDPDFADENYSVYVATSSAPMDLESSTTSFSETLSSNDPDMDGFGNFESKSLDISALAGQTVYFAFRHHAVSDEFVLNIDNIAINVTLSTNEFESNTFTHHYNKGMEKLKLESSNLAMTNIEVYSMLGQNVISMELSNSSESIDLSSLTDGMYLARVYIGGNSKTIKFIKN